VKLFISLLQTVITIKFTTFYCYGLTMLLKVSHSFILPNAIKMLCVNTELLMSDWQTDWLRTTWIYTVSI